MNGNLENIDVSSVNDYTPTSAKSYDEFVRSNSKTGKTPKTLCVEPIGVLPVFELLLTNSS